MSQQAGCVSNVRWNVKIGALGEPYGKGPLLCLPNG